MELEKLFVKSYKRVCINPSEEQISSRLEGINAAKEAYSNAEKIAELLKFITSLYYQKRKKMNLLNAFIL